MRRVMTISIELSPDEEQKLQEHAAQRGQDTATYVHQLIKDDLNAAFRPAWEQVLENMKAVPDAEFERIPADSSEQLDHYLYGTPRRPTG
jgi:predicted DNA-binding protein